MNPGTTARNVSLAKNGGDGDHLDESSEAAEYVDADDPWHWWSEFYSLCTLIHESLYLALELTPNLPPQEALNRWYAEPVKALIIPTSVFFTNRKGFPVLSTAHQEVVRNFFKLNIQVIVRGACRHEKGLVTYLQYVHHLYKNKPANSLYFNHGKEYADSLQEPLQPLADNLTSSTYEIFEMDPYKYKAYERAIFLALKERISDEDKDSKTAVVMVLGAGRGPLVQGALSAAFDADRHVKVFAVEKNQNAVITLYNRVMEEWGDAVTVVPGDMRQVVAKLGDTKADIFVSELLGSFGDNELSPECLDGAQDLLKPDGVSIPTWYTSYLVPLHSSKVYKEVIRQRDPEKPNHVFLETPYVVNLVNCQFLDEPQPLFTFHHPNTKLDSNERYGVLTFNVTQDATLHGFAGFFDSCLFGGVPLSILPKNHSPNMFSWFPIVFPLHHPVHVKAGDRVTVHMWRVVTSKNVWYEWTITEPCSLPLHNPGGRSYTIGL